MAWQIARRLNPPLENAPSVQAPAEWIAQYVTIEEPQGNGVSIIPFTLWPAQREALETLTTHRQVIVLKARQLGMSWLVLALAVWECIHFPGKTIPVFSRGQDEANEMIRRAKGIYQRLSVKPVDLTTDNTGTIAWSNGSRMMAFPATKSAGSSFTGSWAILDEFAKMQFAEELYTSVKPTIDDGGRITIISTANGEGNRFHKLWQGAEKNANSFTPIFLPWHARPSRTPEWYARTEADAVSSAHHRQEYPSVPSEAFSVVGEERFLPSMALWDNCQEVLPALNAREPIVIALDAGIMNDSFAMEGVTRHPHRPDDVASRLTMEWRPPPGKEIDFEGTEDNSGPLRFLRALGERCNIVQVAFDPYELRYVSQQLRREGKFWLKEFPQGPQRLEADKQLLDLITHRRLAHDGNAALRRHIDNANRKPDNESRKLRIVKREAGLKIDLAVALSMASYECLRLSL